MQRLIPSFTGTAFVAGDRQLPDFASQIGDLKLRRRPFEN